jgi:hypothetical protein
MDNQEFEKTVKAVGGKIGLLNRSAYNTVQGMIGDGERITAAGESIDSKGTGAIVITDRFFYAVKMTGLFSSEKTSIILSGIGSASISGGAFSKSLNVTDGTRTYTFPQVSNLDNVISAIQAGKIVHAPGAIPVSPPDAAAELRKFKALLDDGIITQEDFDKKKAALLVV